jgi:hypothetical protein
MKTFQGDFYKIVEKLKNNENFSFIRFSDGELFVLQNKELILNSSGTTLNGSIVGQAYAKEDHKEFIPGKHEFFRKKLQDSLQFKKENYFVGISCKCCVGEENCNLMKEMRGSDDEWLTWSNLLVNSNYPLFIKHFLPALKDKKIVFICNEKANLKNMPINVVKDFRIGFNAMINNFDIHEEISKFIEQNDIKNHVFLFSASSLTNVTAYELFKKHSNNTYIDIGTTLNKFMGLSIERSYLKGYWEKLQTPDLMKVCIW